MHQTTPNSVRILQKAFRIIVLGIGIIIFMVIAAQGIGQADERKYVEGQPHVDGNRFSAAQTLGGMQGKEIDGQQRVGFSDGGSRSESADSTHGEVSSISRKADTASQQIQPSTHAKTLPVEVEREVTQPSKPVRHASNDTAMKKSDTASSVGQKQPANHARHPAGRPMNR